jgi:hypothetical protein
MLVSTEVRDVTERWNLVCKGHPREPDAELYMHLILAGILGNAL